jgi:hypothetical protein
VSADCPRCDRPLPGPGASACAHSAELVCGCCPRCWGECFALAPTVARACLELAGHSFSVFVFHEGKPGLMPELLDFGPLR